jgi:membrane protease subunit HflK
MREKGNKNAVFADIISSLSKYFIVAVILMVLFVCFSGVRFVKSGNVALVLRFGQLVGDTPEEQIHEPGLLLAFPYIIDEVVMVPTGSVIEQKVTTHYTEGFMKDYKSNGYVITGDQNIAVISVSVKYKVTDPVAYALSVSNMEAVVNGSVSNAMIEAAANMEVDAILTSGKEEFSQKTIKAAQEKLDIVQAGVTINNLELTKVSMPKEVVSVYNDVNAATVQASTIMENAQKYMDTTIPAAEAEASQLVSDANTYYSNSVSVANQDLAEFWGVLEEYRANKSVVKARIYNEKVAKAISKIGTVKVVQDGDSKIFIN